MVYSLMFSLPGTPVLFYGEEIGMAENTSILDRTSVRTPMQWTAGHNGGFSNADKGLVAPVVDGGYGPPHINASDQRHDPDSLLHFVRLLIDRYRASAEMGWGEFEPVRQSATSVLAHSVSSEEGRMIALHNFSPEPTSTTFSIPGFTAGAVLVDLLVDGRTVDPDEGGMVTLPLDAYGYRWFRIIHPTGKRLG
jgi:glycosidase